MSDETFDSEALMRDILAVLKKHEVPAQAVALNLSLLMKDFDEIYPEYIYTDNQGFRQCLPRLDNPVVQLRPEYVFNDFIQIAIRHVLPLLNIAYELLQKHYPQFTFKMYSSMLGHDFTNDKIVETFAMILEGHYYETENINPTVRLAIYVYPRDFPFRVHTDASIDWFPNQETREWSQSIVRTSLNLFPDYYSKLKTQLYDLIIKMRDSMLNPPFPRN